MKWNHAGRPKQDKPRTPKIQNSGRVAKNERDGMAMLAFAVIKQWVEDGRPDDIPKEWVAVLKILLERK